MLGEVSGPICVDLCIHTRQILSVIVLSSESLRVCAHDATDSLYLSRC